MESTSGYYGLKGVTDPLNIPAAKINSACWIDSNNNFWLFGGGITFLANGQFWNDLMKFDGQNWTWISGESFTGQSSTYGTKRVPAAGNIIGARSSTGFTQVNGSFWIFGGSSISGKFYSKYCF